MCMYIVLFVFIQLFGFICQFKEIKEYFKHPAMLFLKVSFILLFLVMALREPHLGTDSWMYGSIFLGIGHAKDLMAAIKTSTVSAPLYVLACRVLYRFFPYRQTLIIASAATVNLGFYNFIKRESKDYYTSVTLFMTLVFYFQSFNGTRQYIAVALLLNAFSYWAESKKSIKGWLLYISAVLVHATALIGITYLLLLYKNKKNSSNKSLLISSAIIGTAIAFGQNLFINIFLKVFPQYMSYFGGTGHLFYDAYGQGRQIIVYFGYLLLLVYALLQLVKQNAFEKNEELMRQFNIMLVAVLLGIVGSKSWAINRINFYFTSIAICFIPNIFKATKAFKQINAIARVLTVLFTMIYGFIYLIEDKAGIIPYSFFWT